MLLDRIKIGDMRSKVHNNGTLNFMVVIILLTAMSIAGIFAPERISWLQGSVILKWAIAILCSLILTYILAWLSTVAPNSLTHPDNTLNWQKIKSKGKGQYIQGMMVADLKTVLYFQPLIVLLAGWILDWGLNRIVGIISVLTFVSICASCFRAFRQWELNEKEEKKVSVQT
jgi:hypothetical protein